MSDATAQARPTAQARSLRHTGVEATPPPSPMPALKTYIVEDSPVIRENLIATLEELVSIEVVGAAEDEASAVHWLGQPGNHADLVIVDIFLKAGSGLGVLKAAQSVLTPPTEEAPYRLVVLSNYATKEMRKTCLSLGADRVFDKSNEIDALILYCGRLAAGESGSSAYGELR